MRKKFFESKKKEDHNENNKFSKIIIFIFINYKIKQILIIILYLFYNK